MKCKKCKKGIDQDSIFCKFCGERIREKCPKCGNLEKVEMTEVNICEIELARAEEYKRKYISRKVGRIGRFNYQVNIPLVISLTTLLILTIMYIHTFAWIKIRIPQMNVWFGIIIIAILFSATRYGIEKAMIKKSEERKQKAIQEFKQKFPHHLEIIKKAREVGNEEKARNTFI